jgi:hypothetical protein
VPAAEAAPSAADATAAAAVGPAKAGLSNRAPKKAAAAAPAPLPKPRLSNRKKALLARTLDACRQVGLPHCWNLLPMTLCMLCRKAG